MGAIPIAFEASSVFDVQEIAGGLGGLRLVERAVRPPLVKDYDTIAGEGPARWAARFDLSHWGLLAAREGGEWVGAATLAFDTPGVHMLEGRRDLAVLWDLRVLPRQRGRGVGTALFAAAKHWAQARGCAWLKIETQNINVAACRFYARQGCTLGSVDRFAYPSLPEEVRLLWYCELDPDNR